MYLFSKLIILGVISALQAIALVLIGLAGRGLPATGSFLTNLPLVELLLGMGLLAIASMTLGLFISAAVNTSEKTMPLLVISVMFQVILTGGVFALAGKAGINQISWLAPSRWGYAATASTTNLNVIQLPAVPKAPAPSETPGTGQNKGKKHHNGKGGNTPSASAAPGGAAPPAGSTPSTVPSGGTTPSTTPTTTPTATPTATPSATPSGASATPSASVSSAAAQAQVLADHSPKPKKSGASATPSGSPSGTTTPPASNPASAASSGLLTDPLWDHNAKTWLKDMAAMVVLSLLFTALAWWRLLKLSPGRRK